MFDQNLHTHGTFGDGKDPYENTIQVAIKLGFSAIGFSEHAHVDFSPLYCMTKENTPLYKAEIRRLQKKYADQIDVFCGLEYDLFSDDDCEGYDYIIGSVHGLELDGQIFPFDRNAEFVRSLIDTQFQGDGLRFAKKYYETLPLLNQNSKIDIVGHLDIITKNCELAPLFDWQGKQYQKYALEATHALAEKFKIFEVNTGAISRGYRTTPYPADFILKELKTLGCHVTISSDCHDNRYLDSHFPQTVELIKSCGFTEVAVLTKKGFVLRPID